MNISSRTSRGDVYTNLLNVALYQLGWFSCVLGAALDYPYAGALGAFCLTCFHIWLACERMAEVQMMTGTCLVGVLVDTLQQALGVFTFKPDPEPLLWVPLWVFVIWAQFSTLFHFALRWLSRRYLLAALLGALGGPLAYGGGFKLGAAAPNAELVSVVIILGFVWALLTPTLVWFSDKTLKRKCAYRCFAEKSG